LTHTLPLPWDDLKDRYDVSIIVPTYNRAHYIEECLDSLLNQTRAAIEIIVIDDGSEDDTAERVSRYGKHIRYIQKANGGKPAAVNLALTLVQGNLVWLFDDDDVALPNAIEHRVAALKNKPDAGFVYSPYSWGSDGADKRIVRGCLNNAQFFEEDRLFAELLKGCFFSLNSALVRVEAYHLAGEFDVSLIASEDYDMLIRLARIFKAAYSPEPSFLARKHIGDRGAKGHRTPWYARAKTFQKYDRQVGLKFRNALALGEYLVPNHTAIVSIEQMRPALLARMAVMAGKGCIAEMFEDLQAALATLEQGQLLNANETSQISSAICIGYAYAAIEANFPAFKRHVAELRKVDPAKQVEQAIAKGFFRLAKSYPGSVNERARKLFISINIWIRLYD